MVKPKVSKSIVILSILLIVSLIATFILSFVTYNLSQRTVKPEQYEECITALNISEKNLVDETDRANRLQTQINASDKCAVDYVNCTTQLSECRKALDNPNSYNIFLLGNMNYSYQEVSFIISIFFVLSIVFPITLTTTLCKLKFLEFKVKLDKKDRTVLWAIFILFFILITFNVLLILFLIGKS